MKGEKIKKLVFIVAIISLSSISIEPAYAQFVPVKDATLISTFNSYKTSFSTYATKFDNYATNFNNLIKANPDSIRNVITSPNLLEDGPNGVGSCSTATSSIVFSAYDEGPWASSTAASGNAIPDEVKWARTTSVSLRCLLQDQINWQKIGLSLQIHQLLKNYIADAQTAQLNNQLTNKITAANLSWSKAGNEVVNDGVVTNQAVYNVNASQSIYNVNSRQLDHALDQAAADPSSGNPVGSWGVFEDWRMDVAADSAVNARALVDDPFNFTESYTESTLQDHLNPGDSYKFYERFNDPANKVDGISTWSAQIGNPANTHLGASTLSDFAVQGRIARQEEAKLLDMQSSGFSSVTECSGRADDPYCLEQQNSRAVTPSAEVARSVGASSNSGLQQVQDAKTLDSGAGSSTEAQTLEISSGGLADYDTNDLRKSGTVVDKLVEEFYDVIDWGYFGVAHRYRDWTKGTMLSIYDEMKFDGENTSVVVTDGTSPDNTEYSGYFDP